MQWRHTNKFHHKTVSILSSISQLRWSLESYSPDFHSIPLITDQARSGYGRSKQTRRPENPLCQRKNLPSDFYVVCHRRLRRKKEAMRWVTHFSLQPQKIRIKGFYWPFQSGMRQRNFCLSLILSGKISLICCLAGKSSLTEKSKGKNILS